MRLGNLDARRDWGYAPEFTDGMWRILQNDEPDDYVLATNETNTVRDFVNESFRCAGIEITWDGEGEKEVGLDEKGIVRVAVDPKFYRPAEVELLIGDYSKARQKLGWEPKTGFKELVRIMTQADIADVAKKGW
jgi:GDPmannose 4,6-dehydratase